MGSDETDDEPLTELDVSVDPSAFLDDASSTSPSTITRKGAPARKAELTASSASSPADTEPSTLEPRLVVRGLGPLPLGSSARTTPVGGASGRESEADVYDGDDEEKTAQSIEARLLEVYEQQRAKSAFDRAPDTKLSPSDLTPRVPVRLMRLAAPIPAAGRPPSEHDLDDAEVSEVTARDTGELVDAADVALEPDESDEEEETKTDQAQSDRLLEAAQRAPKVTVPLVAPLPNARRDEGRSKLDQQAAAGGTVRMFFDPRTGKASAHAESEPMLQHVAPPVIVRNVPPAALATAIVPRRSKPRIGRIVLVFVVACGLTASAVYYRAQLVPWVQAQLARIAG